MEMTNRATRSLCDGEELVPAEEPLARPAPLREAAPPPGIVERLPLPELARRALGRRGADARPGPRSWRVKR